MIEGKTSDKVTAWFKHGMATNEATNLSFGVLNDFSKLRSPFTGCPEHHDTKI